MGRAETRRTGDRQGLRYPTDVTDAEWEGRWPAPSWRSRSAGRVGSAGLIYASCSRRCMRGSEGSPEPHRIIHKLWHHDVFSSACLQRGTAAVIPFSSAP
jgi:hypothetical protein